MGTNYYLETDGPCESCGQTTRISSHIGKSSAGWCFALHVDHEAGIHDLRDWEALWSHPGSVIRDEYGSRVSTERMKEIITERSTEGTWTDAKLADNWAVRGPNNLARSKLYPHGAGTWDLIEGEFS